MPNAALIPGTATRIPAISAEIDGIPDAVHVLGLAKSDEPLEDGSTVTDHAVTLPEGLRLTGWAGDVRSGSQAVSAWGAIRRLNRDQEPIEVLTEWGRYEEMLIVRVQGYQEGRGCRFEMELQQVLRVGNPSASLPFDILANTALGRSGLVARGRVSLGRTIDRTRSQARSAVQSAINRARRRIGIGS